MHAQVTSFGAVLDVLVDVLTRGWLWAVSLPSAYAALPIFLEMAAFAVSMVLRWALMLQLAVLGSSCHECRVGQWLQWYGRGSCTQLQRSSGWSVQLCGEVLPMFLEMAAFVMSVAVGGAVGMHGCS